MNGPFFYALLLECLILGEEKLKISHFVFFPGRRAASHIHKEQRAMIKICICYTQHGQHSLHHGDIGHRSSQKVSSAFVLYRCSIIPPLTHIILLLRWQLSKCSQLPKRIETREREREIIGEIIVI